MKNFRQIVINYYTDLKNEIDIECEKLLASLDLNDQRMHKCCCIRAQYLEEIYKIEKQNIESLKNNFSRVDFNQNIEKHIFQPKFCFFIPSSHSLNNQNNLFLNETFGNLIITNQFITQTTRNYLKSIILKRNAQDQITSGKELIMANLISSLIQPRLYNSDIIDLSDNQKNIIIEFLFRETRSEFLDVYDFEPLETMISKNNLRKCSLELNIAHFGKELLSKLNQINSLSLMFFKPCYFESNCFNNLKNLTDLSLICLKLEYLDQSILNGLDQLINLTIKNSRLKKLSRNSFELLQNLKNLKFENCQIDLLEEQRSKCLESFSLIKIGLTDFPKNFFNLLNNLTGLNLHNALYGTFDASYFNCISNLEFLSLINTDKKERYFNMTFLKLSKLKYLAITAKQVPNFENLKELDFLVIYGLNPERMENEPFENLKELKGFIFNFLAFDKFVLEMRNISKMTRLAYFKIIYDEIKSDEIEMANKNHEYFKTFFSRTFKIFTKSQRGHGYLVEVSCYEKIGSFFEQEIKFDKLDFKEVFDYHILYFN
ncbi:unnamed protein product [Brachionus calyciflorus]|uniref:Uncharacterized protein n=1 Tax=Brachionus calyciflorus TaxID=104777 RepID=A0A813ZKU5_9BILA|nr:unnamed protein product [Brachionus calyciflorus]